jgi:hypothetical protein
MWKRAVLLVVLVTSGAVVSVAQASAGTWGSSSVAIPRALAFYAHAQCLGSNSYYLIGGIDPQGGPPFSPGIQRYDADRDSWTPLADMPAGKVAASAICHRGKLYVAGGGAPYSGNTFFIYDIAADTWATGGPLSRNVDSPAMGAYGGRVYVIGGFDNAGQTVSNAVNVYDIATDTWLPNGAPMPSGAGYAGFAQAGSFVYVVGGFSGYSPNVALTQRYDMATDSWQAGPAFTSARADVALAATSVALYAIGGDADGGGYHDETALVERLDLLAWPGGAWTPAPSLPFASTGHRGGFCTRGLNPGEGRIWSTGGQDVDGYWASNFYLPAEACPTPATSADALVVDAGGNGVLEANEPPVVAAPAWRNLSTATVPALTGAATHLTGPPGASYVLDDATAAYGAVAPGAAASCTSTGNCYGVSVSAPSRPVVHWDARLAELVSPTGVLKEWTLHIGGSFDDVPMSSGFYRFVETLLHRAVTGGCSLHEYCPSAPTTRAQMAVFVLVAKEPPDYAAPPCGTTPLFADVPPTSPYCRAIEELARRGVVGGCGDGNYCPTAPATRGQMAIFVLRTLDPAINPPACGGTPMFTDVPASSPYCRWIEELVRRGVVTGCGGGNYCPAAAVTREQMAVFLTVTFGLSLYGA